jgi:small-conductance mechanosensitive channel
VHEYSRLFSDTDKVNSLIIRRFNENGIEIPFPIRTVIMEPPAKRHGEADMQGASE